jgi:hypothetical protein
MLGMDAPFSITIPVNIWLKLCDIGITNLSLFLIPNSWACVVYRKKSKVERKLFTLATLRRKSLVQFPLPFEAADIDSRANPH